MKPEKLLRLSAKQSYQQLKAQGDIYCSALKTHIQITNLFLKHIQYTKNRQAEELQKRLLLIPFLKETIEKGTMVETRKINTQNQFKIHHQIKTLDIACIITQKHTKTTHGTLLSLFLNTKKRPVSPSNWTPASKASGLFTINNKPKNTKTQTKITKTFTNFLKTHNLENQKLLLMISGGIDSIVLLKVAAQNTSSQNLAVFHLNHNLRAESENDQIFVQNICAKKNIQFYTETLPQNHPQTEKFWRECRKNFSTNYAQIFGAKQILTAHHATDLVETMIFRLTKGSGPSGLAPFDISTKPFWNLPKTELIEFAQQNQLEWREDHTNLNTKFARNLIRHKILPSLRNITPNLEKIFVKQSATFQDIQNYLDEKIWIPPNRQIDLEGFLRLPNIFQKEFLRKIEIHPEPIIETEEISGLTFHHQHKHFKNQTSNCSSAEISDCLRWLHNSPPGHSQKTLGNLTLKIKNGKIVW